MVLVNTSGIKSLKYHMITNIISCLCKKKLHKLDGSCMIPYFFPRRLHWTGLLKFACSLVGKHILPSGGSMVVIYLMVESVKKGTFTKHKCIALFCLINPSCLFNQIFILPSVDGRNPAHQLRLVVYPIIYKVLAPSKRWFSPRISEASTVSPARFPERSQGIPNKALVDLFGSSLPKEQQANRDQLSQLKIKPNYPGCF